MENKITLDPKRLDVVDIDLVRPNPWNPKDKDTKQFQEVKHSIEVNGLRGFIVVRENEKDDSKYEIIDGEQRWTSCKELGYEKVIIYNEGKLDDKKAKELTLWWQTQVPFNELSLAKMVSGMIQDYGEISTPYAEKKIKEMEELARFSFDSYKKTSTKPPQMPEGELLKSFMVQLTTSQYDIVSKALQRARRESEADITDGKALEFVCIEYINTPEAKEEEN